MAKKPQANAEGQEPQPDEVTPVEVPVEPAAETPSPEPVKQLFSVAPKVF